MDYENFIYEFIKILMNWGTWNEGVKIYCKNKVYSPCAWPQGESGKWGFDDYERRRVFYEADKEQHSFRDISDVVIFDIKEEDMIYNGEPWPKDWVMRVDLNSELNCLYTYCFLEVNLTNLPLSKKIDAFNNSEELQKGFYEEFDEEAIKEYPEDYGLPSEIEFDSSDEYQAFIEEEIEQEKIKYISCMHGEVRFGNELAEEIDSLLDKYELEYIWLDWTMAFKKK